MNMARQTASQRSGTDSIDSHTAPVHARFLAPLVKTRGLGMTPGQIGSAENTKGVDYQRSRSIAGAALVAVGLFILYEDMAGTIAHVRDVLGSNGSEALGILPAIILATSKAVHGCASEHHAFLTGLFRLLISFWPPLLVIIGTSLLRDTFTERVKALPTPGQLPEKKISKIKTLHVDFAPARSTSR
jgi:hypothetical protein